MNTNDEFCEQIRLNEAAMYALAFSVLRNREDAADAIGEAIVKAYCNLNNLKNSKAFKPWILKIVHNQCIELLRKNCDTVDIDEQYNLSDERQNHNIEAKLTLRETVEKLNQPYRTVVVLYYYESMSVIEISKITGASVMAVKKQLSRAREQLRESLSKEDFF